MQQEQDVSEGLLEESSTMPAVLELHQLWIAIFQRCVQSPIKPASLVRVCCVLNSAVFTIVD